MATSDIKKGPLYVDSTNNRVGIGTATPNEALTIEAPLSGDTGLAINYNGDNKAGITVNPITGQIQVGSHPDLTSAVAYYLSFNTAASNTVYERMKIDSLGRVTMPYQPAFHVYLTTTVASGSYIPHNFSLVNNGGHYNSTDGKFTAPVSGNYMFYATGLTQPTGGTSRMKLVKNGSTYVSGESRHQGGTAGAYLHATIQAVVNMSAGDWVQQYYINDDGSTTLYSDSTPYITFGGHLIG